MKSFGSFGNHFLVTTKEVSQKFTAKLWEHEIVYQENTLYLLFWVCLWAVSRKYLGMAFSRSGKHVTRYLENLWHVFFQKKNDIASGYHEVS